MTRFGHYVTIHEIRRTGLTVVYSGRDDKSPDDQFAIKILEPSALFVDKEHEKSEADKFLNSARLQQKVASSSQYWAPIHEYGTSPHGTFYITDKYERSLQELIDGHVGLGAKGLHAIIAQIVEGLVELKKVYKRPHGNLKATNVLITGAAPDMKVGLSDPLPDKSINAKVHWYADLQAIGKLIYELMTHRTLPAIDGWQVPDSETWGTLGKQADNWRNLCNLLLTAADKHGTVTIDSVVRKLEEMRKAMALSSRRRRITAALVVTIACIAVLVVCWLLFVRGIPKKIWNNLIKDYVTWVDDLHKGLEKDEKIGERWSKNPDLDKMLDKIKIASYPDDVRKYTGYSDFEYLKDPNYGEEYCKEKYKYLIKFLNRHYTNSALKAIDEIRSFFDPNSATAWPTLVEIRKAADGFSTEKWLQPAVRYLNHLADVNLASEKICKDIDEILRTNNSVLDELNSLRDDINGYTRKIPEVYKEMQDTLQNDNNDVSKESFDNWLKQAKTYCKISDEEDPQRSEKWCNTIENTEKIIELIQTYNQDIADKFVRRLNSFKEDENKLSNIPRIENKKDEIRQNVEQLNKTYFDLKSQIHNIWKNFVFDELQQGLNACFLLDENILQKNKTMRLLWEQWNEYKDPNSNAPRDLEDRIKTLKQIKQSNDQLELIRIAQDKDSYSEVAYAAWKRLGELPDTSWPFQHEDLKQDRSIRARLQKEFEKINDKDRARGDYLALDLIRTALIHESEFIERNCFDNKVLGKLVDFAIETGRDGSLPTCQKVASLTIGIADFVADEDWQTDKIDKHLFNGSDMPDPKAPVTTRTFGQWLEEVKKYKKLPNDPRSEYVWDKMISRIDKDITNELSRKPQGAYLVTLENLRDKFDKLEPQIMAMRALSPIEKHTEQIAKCKDYWDELIDITKGFKPLYCKLLDIDPQTGWLVFAEEIGLSINFLPVMDANGKTVEISDWEQIRQGVDNKQKEWLDFFDATSLTNFNDISWPKYIKSKKDPNVILRFIPAGDGKPEPFYMAIREITNQQYAAVVEYQSGFIKQTTLYLEEERSRLIREGLNFRVVEEKWNDYPVTWVYYKGAKKYAEKLGAELPTAKQHEYACKVPPSDSQRTEYAHVRGQAWKEIARKYNEVAEVNTKAGAKLRDAALPLGAIKPDNFEPLYSKISDVNSIVGSDYDSAWPIPVNSDSRRANSWGLYDLIGNVWEWCYGDDGLVICGGSCLAPINYNYANSTFPFGREETERDVGFRIVVPARVVQRKSRVSPQDPYIRPD